MNVIDYTTPVVLVLSFQIFAAEATPTPLDRLLKNRALIQAVQDCEESEARRLIDEYSADSNQKVLTNTRISFGDVTPTNGQPYMMLLPLLDHLLERFKDEPEQREAAVRLLVDLKGRVDYTNIFSRTPLFYAPTAPIAQLFIDNGVNINHSDQCGRIALHEAIRHGRVDVVQVLLANGAPSTIQDNAQHTPLDLIYYSTLKQHIRCRALLLEGPQESSFEEVPHMRALPEDLQLSIISFIPLGALSSIPVRPDEADFADSYIQQSVD
jgi:hypothetical protein